MAKADARFRVDPQAVVVRPAMRDRIRHAFERGGVSIDRGAEDSGDPAHGPRHSGSVAELEGPAAEEIADDPTDGERTRAARHPELRQNISARSLQTVGL